MSGVIVYHDNCHDGITALWAAKKAWPDAEAYPGKYDEPPDLDRLEGKDVLIVDFSWKREPLLKVAEVAKSIRLLDHHKTAFEELTKDGAELPPWATFDMQRSGAGITWDVMMGGERPALIDYVEDRDIWRFALPQSREIHASCSSYPLTLEAREFLMEQPIEKLAAEGVAILRYHNQLVESAAKHALREKIGGYDVPSIACPTIALSSDLGHKLAQGEKFAAVWVQRKDGSRYYGLRSTEDGMDVSAIAASAGGGGHKNAAGFVIPGPDGKEDVA